MRLLALYGTDVQHKVNLQKFVNECKIRLETKKAAQTQAFIRLSHFLYYNLFLPHRQRIPPLLLCEVVGTHCLINGRVRRCFGKL